MNGKKIAYGGRMGKLAFLLAAILTVFGVEAQKRPTPGYLKKAVVYQVVLRNFTRDGNFRAATKMLDHVRSVGVDVVYLAPFVEMDCDMDESGWSERQKKSGYGSPKNSYRISNYDKIDPEYGKDADFKAFNDKAHALGMKVFMDLVYLHCGPNNVIKDMFPDAFQKNADGTVKTTIWHFPYVNFKSPGVRKYLIDSMLHWMRLGCDGFRCDVGDQVPIDFWVEATTTCQKANPELVMINEGTKAEWLEKAFDACYAWPWSFTIRGLLSPKAIAYGHVKGKSLPEKMAAVRAYEEKIPSDSLMFCFLDNHDTATDDWDNRFDRVCPVEAGNAAFALTFLRRGLPLVFNGNEIADNARNSFFAPVEHPARAYKTVDWARALHPDGQKRLELVRRFAKMRHEDPIWSEGTMEWVADGEKNGIVAFTRTLGGRRMLVAANLTNVAADGGPVVGRLSPWEYVVRPTTNAVAASAVPSESVPKANPRPFNRATDWMAGSIGVFQHRLYGACPAALEAMKAIDPKALAEQLAEIGADYFCITLNQCEPSFLAPNDVYEDMCGYRRGEMCSQRDVPAELYEALHAKGVRLMLYSTGTPPRGDTNGVRRIGYVDRGVKQDPLYTGEGARNWAKVFEYWSRRYGERVSGWWIDGCYESIGFDRSGASEFFARALKAGNPNAVVTFNPGIRLEPYSPHEDFICGEINEPFFEACCGRWLNGRQWHLLTYTYSPLGFPSEVRYTDGEWIDWLGPVVANGGCVTIDALSLGTACLRPGPAAQLRRVVAAVRGRLDPNGEDARRIERETSIRRRTDLVEAANISIENGKLQFFRRQYAKANAEPDRALVRRGADGVEIWSDAIQAALDRFGGVRMPQRPAPYVIDRPIVLKSGQSIWMGTDINPLRSSHRGIFLAAPGVKGPLLVNEKPGDHDIFVKGVFFKGVENPVRFNGVKGLVVRDLALFDCSGIGLELAGVTDFRVDGVCFLETDPKRLAVGVRADASSSCGLIRNVSSRGPAPAREVESSARDAISD